MDSQNNKELSDDINNSINNIDSDDLNKEMYESWTVFDNYFLDDDQLQNAYDVDRRKRSDYILTNTIDTNNNNNINNNINQIINDDINLIDIEILTNSSIENEIKDDEISSDEISIISESDNNERLYDIIPLPPINTLSATCNVIKKFHNKNDLNKEITSDDLTSAITPATPDDDDDAIKTISTISDIKIKSDNTNNNNCKRRTKLMNDNTTEIVRKKPKINLCPIINVKKLFKNLPIRNNEKMNIFTKLNKNLLYFGFITGIIGIVIGSYLTLITFNPDNRIKDQEINKDEPFINIIKELETENAVLLNEIRMLRFEIIQIKNFYRTDAIYNNNKKYPWLPAEKLLEVPKIVEKPQEQQINENDQLQQDVSDYVKSMIEMTAENEEQQHQQHQDNKDLSKSEKIKETDNNEKIKEDIGKKVNKTEDEKLEVNGSNRIKLSKRRKSVVGTTGKATEKQGNEKKKSANSRSKLKRQANVVSNEADDSSSDSSSDDKEDEVPQYKELNRKRDKHSHKLKKDDRKNRLKNKTSKKYPETDIVDMELNLTEAEENSDITDNNASDERAFDEDNYFKCDYCRVEKRKSQKQRKNQATAANKENIVKKPKRTVDLDDEELAFNQNKILIQKFKDKLPKLDLDAINKKYNEMHSIDWHDRLMKSREELRMIENLEKRKLKPLSNWYIRRANDRENLRFRTDDNNLNNKKRVE